MQVEPMRPVLKAPGYVLLRLICDKPLSNFGFKCNMRRSIEVSAEAAEAAADTAREAGAYTRTLFSSTSAVSDTKCTLRTPFDPLKHLPNTP
jgi:hypothetical protein